MKLILKVDGYTTKHSKLDIIPLKYYLAWVNLPQVVLKSSLAPGQKVLLYERII